MTARHPNRPTSAVALEERQAEVQHQRGIYTVARGVWMPIPVDDIHRPQLFLNRDLWRQDRAGRVFRPGTRMDATGTLWQGRTLAWLRDHVHQDIPARYYRATLGHDLHVSTYADLYARHFHANWANPFEPDRLDAPIDPLFTHDCDKPWCPVRDGGQRASQGFIEVCGWLSGAKVTTAFVSEEIDELVSTTGTEYADFDFHEVGTSAAAEANTQTALTTTTAIARATGVPTNLNPVYRSVATITGDTTETWAEHGIFNNSTGVAMMDRNLTGGQAVNNLDQVEYTYNLTKAAEA